ncbi:MAG: BON domain-containing protein [Chloroflexi bacterium]|nr:BON domain-containing protein [Chloroflexota bacterium]
MNPLLVLLSALGGAGLMYMLDPDRGRRRRALLRDQVVKLTNRTQDRVDALAEDTRNRAEGLAAEARQHLASESVIDETLVARVRSAMGRVVSNAGAIEITANQGRVTLYGPVLEREVAPLLAAVRAVPGVTDLENRLQVHQQAGNEPSLQGTSPQ